MAVRHDSLSVEIYGQTYNVRGEGDPKYLTELARLVDTRMREIASEVPTMEPMKIAILAALNIADEFSRFKQSQQSEHGQWVEKTEELIARLGRSLAETPKTN
jgi:cell division protein ZapA